MQHTLAELSGITDAQEALNMSMILFDHHYGLNRADLVIKADDLLMESEILKVHKSLIKLKKGQPLEYVIGNAFFHGLTLKVDENVLIPRPETEELVEWISNDYKSTKPKILDIGTGSGCIALALANDLPGAKITACDVSQKALAIAMQNAAALKLNVKWLVHDILLHQPSNLPNKLDVMVSNPPYVLSSEREQMQPRVIDWEPHLALFVEDSDPLLFYHAIATIGKDQLSAGGRLYFEIHEDYGDEIFHILSRHEYTNIELRKDMQQKDRMIRATRP